MVEAHLMPVGSAEEPLSAHRRPLFAQRHQFEIFPEFACKASYLASSWPRSRRIVSASTHWSDVSPRGGKHVVDALLHFRLQARPRTAPNGLRRRVRRGERLHSGVASHLEFIGRRHAACILYALCSGPWRRARVLPSPPNAWQNFVCHPTLEKAGLRLFAPHDERVHAGLVDEDLGALVVF